MKKKINLIASICILLVSVVVMILHIANVFSLWENFSHPILTFVLCAAALFGLYCYVLFILSKSAPGAFFGAVLLSVFAVLVLVHYEFWWIVFVIVPVFCVITALLSYLIRGNKTDEIAENDKDGYKTYEERKKQESDDTEEKLPELKSFK